MKKVVPALAIHITEEIHNNYIQIGGANTQIIVDGADAAGSSITRSTVPWNIVVPPDGLRLMYKFLRISASYSLLRWTEMSWIPLASLRLTFGPRKKGTSFRAGTFTLVEQPLENSAWMEPTPSLP